MQEKSRCILISKVILMHLKQSAEIISLYLSLETVFVNYVSKTFQHVYNKLHIKYLFQRYKNANLGQFINFDKALHFKSRNLNLNYYTKSVTNLSFLLLIVKESAGLVVLRQTDRQ